jgi:radical SAM superfamily enzyme YgiQ (UPF0313 family)
LKILLVYPRYPDTFWSFKHVLKVLNKKALLPPLGLLTVAAMLPPEWEKKLVNLNTDTLRDKDIEWADYVFISAMIVQQTSARAIISRCQALGTKVVAGGPLFTTGCEEFGFDDVDHLVLSEAENIMPRLVQDLEKGSAEHIYKAEEFPDIAKTPIPMWSLIDMRKYHLMCLQYSRGCPFDCEFCDIPVINGHKPRTKDKNQILGELDALYREGWRDSIFFVDDNFIGNRKKLKSEILPAIIEWMQRRKHPFSFLTEASINLADDKELMRLMAEAGFDTLFIGIETPNEESLQECNKIANKNRDLLSSVKTLQNYGFQVQGGFIVGFDSDPPSIFRRQINFIQQSGIMTAMVGLLNAPPETRLYKRLKAENRILPGGTGDNTDGTINFIPKMPYEALVSGYRQILNRIYAPKPYYERLRTFLREFRPQRRKRGNLHPRYLVALIRSMWVLGVKEKGRRQYWQLFVSTLFRTPRVFPLCINLAVQGLHFRKVAEKISLTPVPSLGSGRE